MSHDWEAPGKFSMDWGDLMDQQSIITIGNYHSYGSGQQRGMSDDMSVSTIGNDEKQKKVSDAVVYGPRFCQICDAYCNDLNYKIDVNRHLLSLCLENLVDFIKWARKSEDQIVWISKLLLEYDYLRPEVRNGIIMVLIYTFASIKATVSDKLDMFKTLQDNDTGLSIANRFSLKIYNDPFFYLSFMKSCITGLIDAGIIPENERMNKPKAGSSSSSNKAQYENKEEGEAYMQIKDILVTLVDDKKLEDAKIIIAHISNYWNFRGKFVRNRRFVSALNSLKHINPRPAILKNLTIQWDVSTIDQDDLFAMQNAQNVGVNLPFALNMSAVNPMPPPAAGKKPATRAGEGGKVGVKRSAQEMQGRTSPDAASNGHHDYFPVPEPVQRHGSLPIKALRFERIGVHQWDVKETQIFDIFAFIQTLHHMNTSTITVTDISPVCLVDETRLPKELDEMSLCSKTYSMVSLSGELQQRKALLTSWPRQEFKQLKSFVDAYQEALQRSSLDNAPSLCDFWVSKQTSTQSYGNGVLRQGVLAYEVSMRMGMVIRRNTAVGLGEDIWCCVYPSELHVESGSVTFGDFLTEHLPQLKMVSKPAAEVAIRYHPHKSGITPSGTSSGESHLEGGAAARKLTVPELGNAATYRTIGLLSTPACTVMARLMNGSVFHDFVLDLLTAPAT